MDSDFYHNLFAETGGIFDLIEEKLPWLNAKGKEYCIQQDGARPHTTEGTVEDLTLAGSSDEWLPVIVTQPSNSPDLNLCDLGFFSSLKHQGSQICTHCTDRDQTMQNVVKAFNDYPSDKLEDMWAAYYNNVRSIMEALGGNDYKQAHNGGKKRERDIGASVDLSIDLSDYDRRIKLINE